MKSRVDMIYVRGFLMGGLSVVAAGYLIREFGWAAPVLIMAPLAVLIVAVAIKMAKPKDSN